MTVMGRMTAENSHGTGPAPVKSSASFQSILFPDGENPSQIDSQQEPDCFSDLNLDQVVETATAGRSEYNLQPLFYSASRSVPLIRYRHDVFRDLETPALAGAVREFAAAMHSLRGQLAQTEKLYYELQRQRCFVDAVHVYCAAVRRLTANLAATEPRSAGLKLCSRFLAQYIADHDFQALESQAQKLIQELTQVRYALLIDGKRVTVRRYDPEPDYGADVLETFEKFRQESPRAYRFDFRFAAEMNHVEAAILDRVAQLFPDVFSSLADFCHHHKDFRDSVIVRFDREVQFYLAWIEYVGRFTDAGLSFCYPRVSDQSKELGARDAFDLALAGTLTNAASIVTNDFSLTGPERVIVVTGPNQGGKTTFARMFGQLHYLASLGCPVPAREARLFLCDRLFTHFEREENIENLTGKLEDELLRIHWILERATPDSLLIMNESFLSTTLADALFLSKRIMERVLALDMQCVSVTFLDELASLSVKTVSMVATVDPADPAKRTLKIVRRPADGLAYAMAIAEKCRLTRDAVRARIALTSGGKP